MLWWIPAGTTPIVADAKARLDALRRHGPSPGAFTFRSAFPPPDALAGGGQARGRDDWFCPA